MITDEEKSGMYIEVETKKGKERNRICSYFEVLNVIKSIPGGHVDDKIIISFKDEFTQNMQSFNMDMETLTIPLKMHNCCSRNGMHFFPTKNNLNLIQMEIYKQYHKAKNNGIVKYENYLLGWYNYNGKNVFLYDNNKLPDGIECTCARTIGQTQQGNPKIYTKLLNEYIYPSPELSLAFVIAFAGVVNSRIKEKRDTGNIVVGLTGRTTTGKTTALKLIASVWGNPHDNDGTLILRTRGTEKGVEVQFDGLHGVPILLDDYFTTYMKSKLKKSDEIFDFANGTQKIYTDPTYKPNFKRQGYSGLIVITGETPLLEGIDNKAGLFARVIDFNNIEWTKGISKRNALVKGKLATHIKSVVADNYGLLGPAFAKRVEKISEKDLLKKFDDCLNLVESKMPAQHIFGDRIAKKYAVLLLTAQILNTICKNKINENNLLEIFVDIENKYADERDVSKRAYEYILQYFYENKSAFNIKTDRTVKSLYSTKTLKGEANYKNDGNLHLLINIRTTAQILHDAGFSQVENYAVDWKREGWTKCDTNRDDQSYGKGGRHYHFVYPNKIYEEE